MDDAGTGGHPLDVTVAEHAAVAKRIPMLDIAFQDIGDGLDPPMRMPGEALQIFRRVVIAKIIHHQKRVERVGIAKAENTVEMNASALHCRGGLALHCDGTYRHDGYLASWRMTVSQMGMGADISTALQALPIKEKAGMPTNDGFLSGRNVAASDDQCQRNHNCAKAGCFLSSALA